MKINPAPDIARYPSARRWRPACGSPAAQDTATTHGPMCMTETLRQRGRPKGTGINDLAMLRAISSLLAADAALKPTTAIRRSGVTDPSVIRRLREKLKLDPVLPIAAVPAAAVTATPTSVQPPFSPAPAVAAQIGKIPPQKPRERPVSTAAPVPPSPSTEQPTALPSPATHAPPPEPPHQPAPQPDARTMPPPEPLRPPDPQLEAMRLAAEAAAAMSRLYLHCINNAAQTSPLSIALNGQAMVSQWFAGLMSAQIDAQRKPKP